VLGCLNAVTRQVHTFTNEGYINAHSVCELLQQVAAFYGPGLPLTIFLDNAKYQRCELVQAQAAALGIELAFLPSYSPNLNLIERYWKWVKKQCLYSQWHGDFAAMKAAIVNCLTTGHEKDKEELASLLTWNFQSFTNVTILPV
jgi:transposase